ncbi:hypothetical protein Tco_1565365, partial [Tanacetum coccineum]
MRANDTIDVQRCGLSAKELNEFLSSYPIPSEYDVILRTSTQTIFDAPPGYVGLYTHSFTLSPISGYLLLTFLVSCEPFMDLLRVNTEPPKDVEEPKVQPAEVTTDSRESPKASVFVVHPGSVAARIKERKCKTRGGSSRPSVKRKLAYGSSSS